MRPATCEYLIEVPGQFRSGTAYLDLETEKVPTVSDLAGDDGPFVMQNGERLLLRWSIIMYGVALNGGIALSENSTEEQNLAGLGEILTGWNLGAGSGGFMAGGLHEVAYAATRQFDEMIAKGRFTNARRAHEQEPFFPAVPGAAEIQWRNLGAIPMDLRSTREADIASKDVPAFLRSGQWHQVAVHLLRDVVSLIIMDGDPDRDARKWCYTVLASYDFAMGAILGDEE